MSATVVVAGLQTGSFSLSFASSGEKSRSYGAFQGAAQDGAVAERLIQSMVWLPE